MKTKLLFGVAAIGMAAAFVTPAQAGVSFHVSIGWPVPPPVIVAAPLPAPCPPPVVVAPPWIPVYYPPPVVYRPAVYPPPVVVAPPPCPPVYRPVAYVPSGHKGKHGKHHRPGPPHYARR